jgi:GxxExxY protein
MSIHENEIARGVVDACVKIHKILGPGLLESVYERVLVYELSKRGLRAQRQVPVPIEFEELVFDEAFRADVIVEDKLIVEIKSKEELAAVDSKQLLTYLRLSKRRLGLLVNFGEVLVKDGIHRIVNALPDGKE